MKCEVFMLLRGICADASSAVGNFKSLTHTAAKIAVQPAPNGRSALGASAEANVLS